MWVPYIYPPNYCKTPNFLSPLSCNRNYVLLDCVKWNKQSFFTWAAMTRWRSSTSRQPGQRQSRQRHSLLCPFKHEMTPWLRHLAHFGVRSAFRTVVSPSLEPSFCILFTANSSLMNHYTNCLIHVQASSSAPTDHRIINETRHRVMLTLKYRFRDWRL